MPVKLPPVAVVIAALNEEECLADVIEEIPKVACGLETSTIIVDDGSTDATTQVAHDAGADHVITLATNEGHGCALRHGYKFAREGGAAYIVTLDADGQWNPTETEGVLQPVVDGEADFVIGSRVLGATETDDSFRQAGVHVYSRLVQVLTGVRVTDTSSGFRALRAEITGAVTPDAGAVPDLRAADRGHLRGLPDRRAPDRHAQARGGREQEGPQPDLRSALCPGHPPNLVARAPPWPARHRSRSARRLTR